VSDELPTIRIMTNRKTGAKRLWIDGISAQHVQEVSVRFSTEPLTEVTVTYLTDTVIVEEEPV
jgi:hypothetical protein